MYLDVAFVAWSGLKGGADALKCIQMYLYARRGA